MIEKALSGTGRRLLVMSRLEMSLKVENKMNKEGNGRPQGGGI